jgi:aspartate/methionine/tyrosine aminotransferase
MTLAENIAIMQGNTTVHPSRLAQKMYAAVYGDWQNSFKENAAFYEPRINAIYDVLNKAGLTTSPRPQGALYAVLDDASWMYGQPMTDLTAKVFNRPTGSLITNNAEAVSDIGMRTGMVMVPRDSFGGQGARIVATSTPEKLREGGERIISLRDKVLNNEPLPEHPPLRPIQKAAQPTLYAVPKTSWEEKIKNEPKTSEHRI